MAQCQTAPALGHALSPHPHTQTNHFLSHTQCSQPPLLALGQAPSVLTTPHLLPPSTSSHDDEIVSLAARDAETGAECRKSRKEDAVTILFALMSALLFLHCWLIDATRGQLPRCVATDQEEQTGNSLLTCSLGLSPPRHCASPWMRWSLTAPMPGWAGMGTTEMPVYWWWNHSPEGTELVAPGTCGGLFSRPCPQGTLSHTA